VLFGNRAETRLQIGDYEMAFADAMDSVSFDGHWYKVKPVSPFYSVTSFLYALTLNLWYQYMI